MEGGVVGIDIIDIIGVVFGDIAVSGDFAFDFANIAFIIDFVVVDVVIIFIVVE
jgi:hypothetical protein